MPSARELKEYLFWFVVALPALLWLLVPVHIYAATLVNGLKPIMEEGLVKFLTGVPAPPLSKLPGGIGPSLVGTLMVVGLATVMGVAIAIPVGVLLAEYRESKLARATRRVLALLLQFPTVIISMVFYALLVIPMHHPSALAAAVSLLVVMVPYVALGVEDALKSVPWSVREAVHALGLTRSQVARILLGAVKRAVVAAAVLGVARILGETAPVLFTAGRLRTAYPQSILGPVDTVTLLIFDYALSPYPNQQALAWGAALVLLTVVTAIFVVVKAFAGKTRF